MELRNPLDPNAIVWNVEVGEDVGRIVLSEGLMDGQEAFQDAGFTWNKANHSVA